MADTWEDKLWQDNFNHEHLKKFDKTLNEFYKNLLAISKPLKELKEIVKDKEKKTFIKKLKRRTVFGPSIRSGLTNIARLKTEFDNEFETLSKYGPTQRYLDILFYKKRSAHGKLKGSNFSNSDLSANRELEESSRLRTWAETYYDLFFTSRQDRPLENKSKVDIYVKDLIANLSLGGKFTYAAEKEKWEDIDIKKQENDVDALIVLIKGYLQKMTSLIGTLERERESRKK